VFYDALNRVLRDGQFDNFAESLCQPFYKKGGRRSIPPGVYFRMVFVGYFEGIDSQRGIAWRCEDSLSLPDAHGIASRVALRFTGRVVYSAVIYRMNGPR
jgi:hypothetical protein